MDKPKSSRQKLQKKQQRCGCKQTQYVPTGWIQSKCPFRMGDITAHRQSDRQIMVGIFCACGKEVGEIVFAGNQHLGHWRCYDTLNQNLRIKNIQEWLCLNYVSEMKVLADSMIELQKTVIRINKGLEQL